MPQRLRLVRPDQFEALVGSPARLELLEALQALGVPASVADLARRTGRRPSALYHHLRKLVAAGLVLAAGSRRSGSRDEALFTPAAREIRIEHDPADPAATRALRQGAAAVLRQAGRDYARAVGAAAAAGRALPHGALTTRTKAWLGAEDLAEVARRLKDLQAFMRERSRPGRGRLIALTTSLAELPSAKDR